MRSKEFDDAMLATVPSLRTYAISLTGNVDRANDLVQQTLLKAMSYAETFHLGTSMPAWLFTILRNDFRSAYRRRKREVEDQDGKYAETLKVKAEQYGILEWKELRREFALLPPCQRQALSLVAASGLTYEEASKVIGCATGTIKSRVNRARETLAEKLHLDESEELMHLGNKARRGRSKINLT